MVLCRNNVGYSSTCASIGQVIGIMWGSVSFILLTSENFSNKYLRVTPNAGRIVTMKSKSTETKLISIKYNYNNVVLKKIYLIKFKI